MAGPTNLINVRELLAGNVQLASPPDVFHKITQVINNPSNTLADVARLIENDPGLTARLLKIVNSSYYGFPTRIASIPQAVNIVGFRELRDLVLATLVIDRFSALPNGLISMRQYWMISVRCALIAKTLGKYHPDGKRLQELFIAGLLHEIGRLVIYHRLPELARAALLQSRVENISEHMAQRRVIGLDHYEVGAELARLWRLPEPVIATLEYHERPADAAEFPQEVAVVHLAAILAAVDPMNTDLLEELLLEDAPVWSLIPFARTQIKAVIAEAEASLLEVFRLFYRGDR
ncbi:MAG: HDOD domain-containing protein [Methylococcaceae bacterium]|nr:HDOD domain-containing protein [Methylococcaceae bacterium]